MIYQTESEMQTQEVAFEFAKKININDIILLNGEMGAGKTAFVRGLCEYFSVFETSSPTFNIVNEYQGDIKILHFDLYRLFDVDELYEIGFEDYLNEQAIILIEWPECAREMLNKPYYEVTIDKSGENSREINIERM